MANNYSVYVGINSEKIGGYRDNIQKELNKLDVKITPQVDITTAESNVQTLRKSLESLSDIKTVELRLDSTTVEQQFEKLGSEIQRVYTEKLTTEPFQTFAEKITKLTAAAGGSIKSLSQQITAMNQAWKPVQQSASQASEAFEDIVRALYSSEGEKGAAKLSKNIQTLVNDLTNFQQSAVTLQAGAALIQNIIEKVSKAFANKPILYRVKVDRSAEAKQEIIDQLKAITSSLPEEQRVFTVLPKLSSDLKTVNNGQMPTIQIGVDEQYLISDLVNRAIVAVNNQLASNSAAFLHLEVDESSLQSSFEAILAQTKVGGGLKIKPLSTTEVENVAKAYAAVRAELETINTRVPEFKGLMQEVLATTQQVVTALQQVGAETATPVTVSTDKVDTQTLIESLKELTSTVETQRLQDNIATALESINSSDSLPPLILRPDVEALREALQAAFNGQTEQSLSINVDAESLVEAAQSAAILPQLYEMMVQWQAAQQAAAEQEEELAKSTDEIKDSMGELTPELQDAQEETAALGQAAEKTGEELQGAAEGAKAVGDASGQASTQMGKLTDGAKQAEEAMGEHSAAYRVAAEAIEQCQQKLVDLAAERNKDTKERNKSAIKRLSTECQAAQKQCLELINVVEDLGEKSELTTQFEVAQGLDITQWQSTADVVAAAKDKLGSFGTELAKVDKQAQLTSGYLGTLRDVGTKLEFINPETGQKTVLTLDKWQRKTEALKSAYNALQTALQTAAKKKFVDSDTLTKLQTAYQKVTELRTEYDALTQVIKTAGAATTSNIKNNDKLVSTQAKIVSYLNKYGAAIKANTAIYQQFVDLQNKISNGQITPMGAIKAFNALRQQCIDAGIETDTLYSKLLRTFSGRFRGMISAMGWSLVTSKLREIYTNVVELDTAMTELKKVTEATASTYTQFLEDASTRAKELGATLTEVVEATSAFARLCNRGPRRGDMAVNR